MSTRELTPEAHKTIAQKMDALIAFAALYGVIVDVKFRYPKGAKAPKAKTKATPGETIDAMVADLRREERGTCPECGGAPDHVECPICGTPAGEGCCAGNPDRCFNNFVRSRQMNPDTAASPDLDRDAGDR